MTRRRVSVASQLLVLQTLLLFVVVGIAAVTGIIVAGDREERNATDEVLQVANGLAGDPLVAAAAVGDDPSAILQPYAERERVTNGVDFVTIMRPDRTRWTHPDPNQIGKPFIGTIEPALAGTTFTETFAGTLGPSVRAVAPVRAPDGTIVGLVAVGITTEAIHTQLARQLPYLLIALTALLLIALAGAFLVSRRLRRQTGGLDAPALGRLLASRDAVLHSIRDGLLVVDNDFKVALVNDEAVRLLALDRNVVGESVGELPVPATLRSLLETKLETSDEFHLAGDRVLVVSQAPALLGGKSYGTVMTLQDRTELEAMSGELDTIRALTESLRSQAHEAANKLHTVVMLVETGRYEKAVEYATSELELSQRLTDRVVSSVDEPVLAALLLGKTAQAAERGVDLTVSAQSRLSAVDLPTADLVTIVGNLLDNATDASAEAPLDGPREVQITLRDDAGELLIEVSDTGAGLPPELVDSAFTRGWSTKPVTTPGGRGLGLALVQQVVRRHRGSIAVSSAEPVGAKFEVRLPVPTPAQLTGVRK